MGVKTWARKALGITGQGVPAHDAKGDLGYPEWAPGANLNLGLEPDCRHRKNDLKTQETRLLGTGKTTLDTGKTPFRHRKNDLRHRKNAF